MKKVATLQSNYIPWKGYFDMIAAVDEFILYDDMQYTRRDWRNRNQIKTPQGVQWLTVPRTIGLQDAETKEVVCSQVLRLPPMGVRKISSFTGTDFRLRWQSDPSIHVIATNCK